MPLVIDIMENTVIGPAIRQGLEQGRAEGRTEGRAEGELAVLTRVIEKKFGPMPEWAKSRIGGLSVAELEGLADRIFDAGTIESLLA